MTLTFSICILIFSHCRPTLYKNKRYIVNIWIVMFGMKWVNALLKRRSQTRSKRKHGISFLKMEWVIIVPDFASIHSPVIMYSTRGSFLQVTHAI